MLGFNFDDAYRVLDSYWMHGDVPYYKNTDLVSLVKEITKEDNYYQVICFLCAKELDLLSIESPYKTCPSCKKELNYWRDFGLDELSGMPSSEIYLDYIEKNAERKKTAIAKTGTCIVRRGAAPFPWKYLTAFAQSP